MSLLFFRFHTSFLDQDQTHPNLFHLTLSREEIDNPHKERTWDIFTQKFSIKLSAQKVRWKMLKLLIRYVFCFVLCVPSVKVSKLFLLTSLTLCARLCFLPNHNFYAKVLSLTITTGDCTFYAVFLEFLFFISKLLESEKGNTGFIYNISQISSNFFFLWTYYQLGSSN
jgi:hypothetical protein